MLGRGQMCNFSWAFGNVEKSPVKETFSIFTDPYGSFSIFTVPVWQSLTESSRGCTEAQKGQRPAYVHTASLYGPLELDRQGPGLSRGARGERQRLKAKAVLVLMEFRVPSVKVVEPTERRPSECHCAARRTSPDFLPSGPAPCRRLSSLSPTHSASCVTPGK